MAWLVLRAFSCAHIDDGSRVVLALRGSGARGVLPFSAELPAGARHPRREIRTAAAAGDVLSHPLGSRRGGCRSALPPTPLVRCNRPHLRGHPHPTATHLPARPAHPCAPAYGAPDEPEVVAPLAEASLAVVLIELAGARRIFMCGCGGAVVGRGIDWCWGNVIGVRA